MRVYRISQRSLLTTLTRFRLQCLDFQFSTCVENALHITLSTLCSRIREVGLYRCFFICTNILFLQTASHTPRRMLSEQLSRVTRRTVIARFENRNAINAVCVCYQLNELLTLPKLEIPPSIYLYIIRRDYTSIAFAGRIVSNNHVYCKRTAVVEFYRL